MSRPSKLPVAGSFPLIHINKKAILKSDRKVIDVPQIPPPPGRHSSEPARVAYEGSEVPPNPGKRRISGADSSFALRAEYDGVAPEQVLPGKARALR